MKILRKSKLALLGGKPTTNLPSPHYNWPIVTDSVRRAVLKQLSKSISIYNRSGIFEEFENVFADYHGRKFALVGNSGTTSIYSMYFAAGLEPGDEVICPVYTFFATVSPLLFTGAVPVFADCDENGNIDPAQVAALVTRRTKAVVVTHMWGIPVRIDEIARICKKYKLILLEDCSHAHGARYRGKAIGSWGDISVWSLQGQKTVSGGEGGVLTTNSSEYYYRALMLGHYNKRCLQEIPPTHPFHRYGLTGLGLKFRAHPLAIAIALEQFRHLDGWLKQREIYSRRLIEAGSNFPGLQPPSLQREMKPSWYALVWQYDRDYFDGLPLKIFYRALQSEGLKEFDLPRSTGPLHLLPLFRNPGNFFPGYRGYKFNYQRGDFPKAENFYRNALKLPVWVRRQDNSLVDIYQRGLVKVLKNHKELLRFK